jgi:hypothetical protein
VGNVSLCGNPDCQVTGWDNTKSLDDLLTGEIYNVILLEVREDNGDIPDSL